MFFPKGALHGVLLFPKAILGGVFATILVWIAILAYQQHQNTVMNEKMGITGLGAVAGGWSSLLNSPYVVVILSIGFGIGFYIVTWISRH